MTTDVSKLTDHITSVNAEDASYDELVQWYNFHAACLGMLIRKAGGSVTLDPRDLDSVPKLQKIVAAQEQDTDIITLTLVDV